MGACGEAGLDGMFELTCKRGVLEGARGVYGYWYGVGGYCS